MRDALTYSPVIPSGIHLPDDCCRTLRAVQEQREGGQEEEERPRSSAAPGEAGAHPAHGPGAGASRRQHRGGVPRGGADLQLFSNFCPNLLAGGHHSRGFLMGEEPECVSSWKFFLEVV